MDAPVETKIEQVPVNTPVETKIEQVPVKSKKIPVKTRTNNT